MKNREAYFVLQDGAVHEVPQQVWFDWWDEFDPVLLRSELHTPTVVRAVVTVFTSLPHWNTVTGQGPFFFQTQALRGMQAWGLPLWTSSLTDATKAHEMLVDGLKAWKWPPRDG